MRIARIALVALAAASPAGRGVASPWEPSTAPEERPALLVLAMGYDAGFTRLATVRFTDGSTQTLSANQGFYFAAGAAFLPVRAGAVRFDTAATLGVKGWNAGADNGEVRYLAFPLDLVERVWFEQVRFGLGLSLSLAPRISSSGVLSGMDADLKNSLGLQAQVEWIGARRRSGVGVMLGARFLWQRFASERTGASIDAKAAGVLLGLEL